VGIDRTHGVTEVPYEVSDIEEAIVRVTGDRAFARYFFGRYVRGREAPDFPTLLALAGIQLAPAFPKRGVDRVRTRGAWWRSGDDRDSDSGLAPVPGGDRSR